MRLTILLPLMTATFLAPSAIAEPAADRFTLTPLLPLYLADSPSAVDRPEQHTSSNEANNPLTPKITLNLHDYYIPRFVESDDDANQLLLRGVLPHNIGGLPQLLRFTLPIVTVPEADSGHTSGVGDLTLVNWFVLPPETLPFELGIGPVLVIPLSDREAISAEKWQTGVSAVGISAQPWGLLGGLATYQFSFAGDDDRDDVSLFTFQPIAIYNLQQGFYLRSSAIWTFDWNEGAYYLPVGLGAGKVWALDDGTTINAFIEPQYTLFEDTDAAPEWQIFIGVNFQFPLSK